MVGNWVALGGVSIPGIGLALGLSWGQVRMVLEYKCALWLSWLQVSARLDQIPDASQERLAESDGVCIICREEMSSAGRNKVLPCGHIFHMHCLR